MKKILEFYKGKRVFVTGHTGFKGAWLCRMLSNAGAVVTGYSLPAPTEPSLFDVSGIGHDMNSVIGDIRDFESLKKAFDAARPEIVLHLAAQPIVRDSYKDPVYTYAYFEGSFNLSKIESAGKTVGYELHFISNRPFAIGEPIKKKIIADTSNYVYEFTDYSDEIGYIYPKTLTIVCKTNGDLTIKNSIEERSTEIYDCETNEIITFDDSLSFSSDSREIQNAFNYVFFRIANTYTNRVNRLEISIPCEITFEYIPIIKGVGL